LSYLFFDNNGNFQWASIAAFIAFLVGLMSFYNNYKSLKQQKELNIQNFKGNIVSTARIEWIQEVRKKCVDFISICYDLIGNIKSSKYDETKILELKSTLEKNATLLILYFGPDKDNNKNNDFIVYLIELLLVKITNKDGWYDKKHIVKLEDEVNVLKDFLRIYFKAEWKRANGEVTDAEVQKYLEKHQLYIRIREIYQSGFNEHQECIDNFYIQLKERYNQN
jgi:hypothetical protein